MNAFVRYAVRQIYEHDSPNKLTHATVCKPLTEDQQGNLWIATKQGLSRLDKHRQKLHPLPCTHSRKRT